MFFPVGLSSLLITGWYSLWDLWDFSVFGDAIDQAFSRIASEGNYYGIVPILPLGDTWYGASKAAVALPSTRSAAGTLIRRPLSGCR